MPNFVRPSEWPEGGLYPHQAGRFIEGLRRFIGHDRLVQRTADYRSPERVANGIRIARLREQQPLIEAFEAYQKAIGFRRRQLNALDGQLADLANVAAHCHVIAPTLSGAIERHHRDKLINLDGQLKPLLLEWKTASHFARANRADIAWIDVDQTGPEFIARAGDIEWDVECKWQSQMVVELLGQSEADRLATQIIDRTKFLKLRGDLLLHVPSEFDSRSLEDAELWPAALDVIQGAGVIQVQLPGGLLLEGELHCVDGRSIDAGEWKVAMQGRMRQGARLYSQARAVGRAAVDPLELQMIGPRRNGAELIEYLWERKFSRAAAQCSQVRGAVLVFEWDDLEDPSIFAESAGIQIY